MCITVCMRIRGCFCGFFRGMHNDEDVCQPGMHEGEDVCVSRGYMGVRMYVGQGCIR